MTVTRAPIRNVVLATHSIYKTAEACLKREVVNYDERRIWCATFYEDDPAQFILVLYCGLSPDHHYSRSYFDYWEFYKEQDKKGLVEEFTRSSAKSLGYLLKR